MVFIFRINFFEIYFFLFQYYSYKLLIANNYRLIFQKSSANIRHIESRQQHSKEGEMSETMFKLFALKIGRAHV